MKILKDTNTKFTLTFFIVSVLFISIISISELEQIDIESKFSLVFMFIGVLIGGYLSFMFSYLIIKKLGFKILLLFLIAFISSIYLVFGKEIFISLIYNLFSQKFIGNIEPVLYTNELILPLINGFIKGLASMFFSFLIIHKTQSINLLIFFFLYIFIDQSIIFQDNKFFTYIVCVIFCIIYLIICLVYFIQKHSVFKGISHRRKKIFLQTFAFIFFCMLFILSFWFSYKAGGNFNHYIRDINDIRVEQQKEEYNQNGDPLDYRSDLDFESREGGLVPQIVGFYRSESPYYLKTDVYNVYMDADGLWVTSCINDSYFYEDYFYEEFYDEYGEYWIGFYLLIEENKKDIEVVYKYGKNKIIPSVQRVIGLESSYKYSNLYGLIKSNGTKNGVEHITYQSTTFDYYVFQDYLYNKEYYYNNYFYNDKESDRYEEISVLAYEITNEYDTTYKKVLAVKDYLQENYLYTKIPGITDLKNPIDDFILDKKKGFCSYFAVSMSTMLDMVGIESRVVSGYYSDLYIEELDAYVILSTDAHAWVEVYLPGYGWVNFEPTTSNLDPELNISKIGGIKNLSLLTEDQIEDVMQSIDTEMSFDDIDDLEEGISYEEYKKKLEEANRKKEEEDKKKEEEKKQREYEESKEEFNKKIKKALKILLIILLPIISSIIIFIASRYLYKRIKYKEFYRDLKNKKIVRKIILKTKKLLIRNLDLDEEIVMLNNNSIIKLIDKKDFDINALKRIFMKSDKILYSKKYKDKDMLQLKQEFNSFKKILKR